MTKSALKPEEFEDLEAIEFDGKIKAVDYIAELSADEKKMEEFRDYLTKHGLFTTIRASRGQDIFAACGLLSTSKKNGSINNEV